MADRSLRLDRWLWAARFFKTRAFAAAAVAGGKVHVNGGRAKPAKQVQVGDALRIRVGPYEWLVTVRGLAEQLKMAPAPAYQGKGRPTKKQRREIERLEEGGGV